MVSEETLEDLKQEELWWAQRAKVNWLQSGDINTKYFHQKASMRKRKNTIHNIQDDQGNNWQDSLHFQSIFTNHFQKIFDSSGHTYNHDIFNVVKDRLSIQDHNLLNTPFLAKEVYDAIKSLKAKSAPRPDGLSTLFYQKYWEIIGHDITEYTLNILNNNGNVNDINHTYISLIPKVNSPNHPSEFRPISLCNVILKIITKTLANRIKLILPNIIKDYQSAFLPGRLITDNSLLVFEIFHHIKIPGRKKMGMLVLNLTLQRLMIALNGILLRTLLGTWASLTISLMSLCLVLEL